MFNENMYIMLRSRRTCLNNIYMLVRMFSKSSHSVLEHMLELDESWSRYVNSVMRILYDLVDLHEEGYNMFIMFKNVVNIFV